MPYFKWRGVDLLGRSRSGTMFAKSVDHLDQILFKRNVALLASKQKSASLLKRRVTLPYKIELFAYLAQLIRSGILLPQALEVAADQVGNTHLQEIIYVLVHDVHNGKTLSSAMSKYPKVFDRIMIQLIRVGEESGDMAHACNAVAQYCRANQDFYSQLRTALLVPSITLGFFVLIATVLFVYIVPRFADIFLSMKQELPSMTQWAMRASNFMRSWYSFFAVTSFILLVGITKFLLTTSSLGRRSIDILMLHLPFAGIIVKRRFVAYFLQSLSLLIESGMQLVPSLHLIQGTLSNHIFAQQIDHMAHEVESGSLLSQAMVDVQEQLWPQDVIAVVHVAEESGRLPYMLNKIADMYHEQVKKYLTRFTLLLQPILMIILGLLIMLLIVALYMPLFNLSHMI